MHSTPTLALAVLLLPSGAEAPRPAPASGDTLRFAPADGAELTKVFTTTGKLEATEAEIVVPGESGEVGVELAAEWERGLKLRDTYVACSDGRPTELRRAFEELSHEVQSALLVEVGGVVEVEDPAAATGESELEGTTVTFAWNPESGSYRKAFADGEGDAELLEGLAENTDLRGFLPRDEVSDGDRWDVEAEAVVALLRPGGDLSLAIESDGTAWEAPAAGIEAWFYTDLGDFVSSDAEVDATCTYEGRSQVDGRDHGVVAIEVELSCESDVRDGMQDAIDRIADMLPGAVEVTTADLTVTMEGEGELVWDLEAGHARSLTLELELTVEIERAIEVDAGGEFMEVTTDMTIEGELIHELALR